jgi:Uri superfamily endonuclease
MRLRSEWLLPKEYRFDLQLVRIRTMFDLHEVPASQGTYGLHFFIARSQAIVIGCLGQQHCSAGHYFYVGSAHGAGGLQARVSRHVRGAGARRWHVDYLRAVAEVREVFYTVTDMPLECVWSQALAQLPAAFIPVPHFGASDCRSGCAAHLIAFPLRTHLTAMLHILERVAPAPIVCLSNC